MFWLLFLLYLLAQVMYHLNGRRPGTLFLSTLEPPLGAAGLVQWAGPVWCWKTEPRYQVEVP